MSKQRNNTKGSKQTEEEVPEVSETVLDLVEFESTLQSFNKDSTKLDVVRQIKEFEALIVEEPAEVTISDGAAADDDAKPGLQKITLPNSGKVIQARGDSLKAACELVAAWGKSTRTSTANDEQR